jgi:hypothetical protein
MLRKCLSCTCFWGDPKDLQNGTNSTPCRKCLNTVTLTVSTTAGDRCVTHYCHRTIGSNPGSHKKRLSKKSALSLQPTSNISPVSWRKGHKTAHLPPLKEEIKNVWSCSTTPPYTSMAQYSYTENFALTVFHHKHDYSDCMTILTCMIYLDFYGYPDWGFSVLFPQL